MYRRPFFRAAMSMPPPFKNIFRIGSETLEKSVCSRYTGLDGRFVHGGSLLCAFLYGAVSELALGHGSFLCHRHEPVTPWKGESSCMEYYTLFRRNVKRRNTTYCVAYCYTCTKYCVFVRNLQGEKVVNSPLPWNDYGHGLLESYT